jgi:hypothetical protein
VPQALKRFKISLEVATLDVAAPFTMALDGDATILPSATTDELITEVGHCDARWYARLGRHARSGWCTRSRGGALLRCRQLMPPSLMMRGVDGGDDELVDVVTPLLHG